MSLQAEAAPTSPLLRLGWFRVLPNGPPLRFSGPMAATLRALIRCGKAWFTTDSRIDAEGDTAEYVATFRALGMDIKFTRRTVAHGQPIFRHYALNCLVVELSPAGSPPMRSAPQVDNPSHFTAMRAARIRGEARTARREPTNAGRPPSRSAAYAALAADPRSTPEVAAACASLAATYAPGATVHFIREDVREAHEARQLPEQGSGLRHVSGPLAAIMARLTPP